MNEVEDIVGRCVQCGLCNAACPTYVLTGDERDSPRGRIALIGEMFASARAPSPEARLHLGRCLSCMSCATACPAGVDYGHLINHARAYIAVASKPTAREQLINWFSGSVIPYPGRLKWVLRLAPLLKRSSRLLRWARFSDLTALAEVTPDAPDKRAIFSGPGTAATTRDRRGRVILLAGCAQQVLRSGINDATIRLLARGGIDVEVVAGVTCCGRAAGQIGEVESARQFARANIDAWTKVLNRDPADAILFNSAGCGVQVKDYPHLLGDDPHYAAPAKEIAKIAMDVTEYLSQRRLGPPQRWSSLKIAYLAPCALRHGQGVTREPAELIHDAGYSVVELPEADLCCGGAGAFAFKEPEIAAALRDRKFDHILAVRPDVIATGSISCLKHLEALAGTPVVHTVELLDWAHGGPAPSGLEGLSAGMTDVPGPPPLEIEDYIRA